jgi:FdhE protein
MSLQLLSQESIAGTPGNQRISGHLRLPDPAQLLNQRAARCNALADGHPLDAYLRFVAVLAHAAEGWLASAPALSEAEQQRSRSNLAAGRPPLEVSGWPREALWHSALHAIAAAVAEDASLGDAVRQAAQQLKGCSTAELDALADRHLAGDYAAIPAGFFPLVSAALSVYWSRLAAAVDVAALTQEEGLDAACPVCGSAPSVSMVSVGTDSGLRYLHCALCESEWHVVRALCSACGSGDRIDYFSLDQARTSAVRAEACGSCSSYLKVLYPEFQPGVDAVADDLATLSLDLAMAERGLERSGPSLYVSPG